MTNLMTKAVDMVGRVRAASISETVTYKRGAYSVSLTVARGSTGFTNISEDEFEVQTHITDFLIEVEDLILNGTATKPDHGDIIETDFGKFEVSNLAGEGCWRYSDTYSKTFRVHAKRID